MADFRETLRRRALLNRFGADEAPLAAARSPLQDQTETPVPYATGAAAPAYYPGIGGAPPPYSESSPYWNNTGISGTRPLPNPTGGPDIQPSPIPKLLPSGL